MAYSYTTYTGNGSTTQYAVAFGYIRREHVLATVAGSAATFTWVNSSLIQMDTAPANGAAVRVGDAGRNRPGHKCQSIHLHPART